MPGGGGEAPQLQGRVREYGDMGTHGIFPFWVILGAMSGCNWSVRVRGCFEVAHLMGLFAFSVEGHRGPFCLDPVSTVQASKGPLQSLLVQGHLT